jgi:hypothetical protein
VTLRSVRLYIGIMPAFDAVMNENFKIDSNIHSRVHMYRTSIELMYVSQIASELV